MTVKETKQQLVHLLKDDSAKVVSLVGKWGTGKSFMWDELKLSDEPLYKAALYASIFGESSIDQIKLKLIHSAAKSLDDYPLLYKALRETWKSTIKVAEGFHKGFTALNDIGLVLAPTVLRGRLLVLDDIERKHEKLSIDEILGFIDEMTKRYGCRVLLILNDDKLNQRDLWDMLREKVIDQELLLSTSTAEAIEIALTSESSKWSKEIALCTHTCGITNIRIAKKIIKVVNSILNDQNDLSSAVLNRTIPSIVLLSAIHYKGLEDGPDFSFVLDQGSANDWIFARPEKQEKVSEDDERKSRWQSLMHRMGIYSCDEFELLVVEYLKSGLFDRIEIVKVIDRYVREGAINGAVMRCNLFFERVFWEHRLTDEQLLEEGKVVAAEAALLPATTVTSLYDELIDIPGGSAVANEAIESWIKSFRQRDDKDKMSASPFHQKVHPKIKDEFDSIERGAQASISAIDACKYIASNRAWGERQTLALRSASVFDFEELIRHSQTNELKTLLWQMIDLCVNKESYTAHFGSAMDNFVEASRSIVQDEGQVKLAKVLRRLFAEKHLSSLLEPTLLQKPVSQ